MYVCKQHWARHYAHGTQPSLPFKSDITFSFGQSNFFTVGRQRCTNTPPARATPKLAKKEDSNGQAGVLRSSRRGIDLDHTLAP